MPKSSWVLHSYVNGRKLDRGEMVLVGEGDEVSFGSTRLVLSPSVAPRHNPFVYVVQGLPALMDTVQRLTLAARAPASALPRAPPPQTAVQGLLPPAGQDPAAALQVPPTADGSTPTTQDAHPLAAVLEAAGTPQGQGQPPAPAPRGAPAQAVQAGGAGQPRAPAAGQSRLTPLTPLSDASPARTASLTALQHGVPVCQAPAHARASPDLLELLHQVDPTAPAATQAEATRQAASQQAAAAQEGASQQHRAVPAQAARLHPPPPPPAQAGLAFPATAQAAAVTSDMLQRANDEAILRGMGHASVAELAAAAALRAPTPEISQVGSTAAGTAGRRVPRVRRGGASAVVDLTEVRWRTSRGGWSLHSLTWSEWTVLLTMCCAARTMTRMGRGRSM